MKKQPQLTPIQTEILLLMLKVAIFNGQPHTKDIALFRLEFLQANDVRLRPREPRREMATRWS